MNFDDFLRSSNDFTAYVKACKAAIKLAIEGKGVDVGESDLLSTYAEKVALITGGGSVTIFTVTFFDYDETTILKTQDVLQGGDVNPPANPTREAYTFTGWSASSLNVQSDLTIVAQYTYSPNVVALLDYDLSLIELQNVATGADITAENPSNANMTFTGWSDSLLNVQGNRALIARYNSNPVNSSFIELVLTPETGLVHTFNFFKSVPVTTIINFGDGSYDYVPAGVYISIEHTYTEFGNYTVEISSDATYPTLCGWPGLNDTQNQKGILVGDSAKAIVKATEGNKVRFSQQCFQFCVNLEAVNLLTSASALYQRLFYNCSSLKNIVIPSSISSAYGDTVVKPVFEGCTSLERLVFLGSVPTFNGDSMDNIPAGCIIYVPDEYISDYQSALIAYGYTIQGLSTLPNSYEV